MVIAWWNPFAAIGEAILNFFVGVLLFLDSIVYSLISWVYQIILVLCQVDILNNSFEIDALINRVYAIIGVVVLFLLAYSLLKSMVNPDDALKGKKSPVTIIKDVIISIVLIALIPTIFDFAMNFQTSILQNNTLGKIILGSTTVTERDENGNVIAEENSTDVIRNGGTTIASNVLRAFLHPNYSNCTVDETSDTGYDCSNIMIEQSAYGVKGSVTFDEFWTNTVEAGSIGAITDLSNNIVDGGVTYYYIISTVAGVFVLIVLLSYCFDIALRLVKLAVYQLIAPLPILSRIMPGEQGGKVFNNWVKATISTYVEVFIRLAILFFAILIIKIVVQNFPSVFNGIFGGSAGFTVRLFAQLFIIIGIILFIKQAPGMIKEITGLDGGKYNVFGSAMKGFNTLRSLPKIATQTWNNTNDNPNHGKIWNNANRLKNALLSTGKGIINNHEAEYKGLGDLNKNYEKITTDNLAERRRKEAIRKAKLNRKERYKREPGLKEQDRAAAIHEYFHGSTDTKAIEEKIKLANSVGKDIKSKIVDEAIDKNLRVKRLDNAWKTLQNKAVDANDYFERVTADNYEKLGLTLNDVGAYYDAQNGRALDYNTAYNEARRLKETQEGALKKQRDNAAFETMWGAINGDFSVFDSSDVDTEEKQKFVYEFFNNLQSQFNENIEYAKAKNPDVASSARLSARIDVSKMSDAKALKDMVGDKKLEADTLATGYDKDLAAANSREQLKAEIKGDKK